MTVAVVVVEKGGGVIRTKIKIKSNDGGSYSTERSSPRFFAITHCSASRHQYTCSRDNSAK